MRMTITNHGEVAQLSKHHRCIRFGAALFAIAAFLSLGFSVYAQTVDPNAECPTGQKKSTDGTCYCDSGIPISIPIPVEGRLNACVKDLPTYIVTMYKFGIGIIAVLSSVMIMVAGARWLTSGGNQEKVGQAKTMITSAILGLVLALTSFIILRTINPNLVDKLELPPTILNQLR